MTHFPTQDLLYTSYSYSHGHGTRHRHASKNKRQKQNKKTWAREYRWQTRKEPPPCKQSLPIATTKRSADDGPEAQCSRKCRPEKCPGRSLGSGGLGCHGGGSRTAVVVLFVLSVVVIALVNVFATIAKAAAKYNGNTSSTLRRR